MRARLRGDGEGGYTLAEMVVVTLILGVVVGGLVTIFARAINADADQTRRFQSQQDLRIAVNKMRNDIHASCTVSNPTTYNSWESSITLYSSTDSCAAGTHSISWCLVGSGTRYGLYRIASSSCTGATIKYADYITSSSAFIYLPPNSYVTSLGSGTTGISTQAANYTLPRIHIDLKANRQPTKSYDQFRVVDDLALRNGPRSCTSGTASC